MYESFFGLNEKPFNLTPDPRYFYLSEGHREALAALIYGVRERAGLITLTGPVGMGKTMILASFLDQIRENAETASFSGAVSGDRVEFLKDLCGVLGITPEQGSLFGLSQAVKDFAIRKAGEGRSVVVLVDEAQDLGREELEHFHHLCNLETPEAKLVQIVLAGTEKLEERLKDKSLEALWQRVAIRCEIKPIGPEETIEYICHRLRVAGSSSSALFSDDALRRIVNFARGVPRLINLVCNQAMISAYSSGSLPVDEHAVLEALKELEGGLSGVGTGEMVGPDDIRGMIEAGSRRREEEADPPEGERDPYTSEREDSHKKVEAEEEGGITIGSGRRWGFSSRFGSGRRSSLALALIVLIAMAGVVMAIGLLRARDDVVERAEVVSLEEPDAGWGGDSPERASIRYGTPTGGPGQPAEEESTEIRTGPSALGRSGAEQVFRGSGDGFREGSGQGPETMLSSRDQVTGRGKGVVNPRQKDLVGIALRHYGRLDAGMLKVLREKNPQIRDWNDLTENVQLTLPDMPEPANGGVDFYTIQVGAFREEGGASRRASDMAKKGSQNLFLVKGGADKKLTFVCVGVFESRGQSLAGIRQMQEWGYEDAFPLRIRAKRLEDILQPYAPSPG